MAAARRAGAALAVLLVALAPRLATALPLFADPGPSPCARCHVAVPVLNAAGARFLDGGERPAVVPAGRARARPVSVVWEAGAGFVRAGTAAAAQARARRGDGQLRQRVLELHAAGSPGEHVSFRLQAGLDSAMSAVHSAVAFVQFRDVVRRGALAIRAGRFDAGLPFLSAARRPTGRGYLAPVEVAADGVELSGARSDWGWAAGLMNSSRTAPPGGHGFNRLEDTYLRLTRERGEQQFGARLLFDRQDSNVSWHAWLQRLQAQVGGRFGGGRLWIVPAYTLDRFDDRPAPGIHQRHQYALLEGLAVLGARYDWTLAARLEHAHVTPTVLTPGDDRDLEAVRLTRALSPGARVAIEWSRAAVTAGGPRESRLDATVQLTR